MNSKWRKMTNAEIMKLIGMELITSRWNGKVERILRYGGTSDGDYTVLEITPINQKYRFFKGELYTKQEVEGDSKNEIIKRDIDINV